MSDINYIENNESGYNVRNKLNSVIDEANKVKLKVDNSKLSGGDIHQILKKLSSDNQDFGWSDITAIMIKVLDSLNNYSGDNVDSILAEIGETRRINGYDLQAPESLPTLSYDETTRTFSVSVKNGSSNYYFWVNNKKIIKTTTETVIIPNTTGAYYIYFDNNDNLQTILESNITDNIFYNYAITGLVYYNSTIVKSLVENRLYGVNMPTSTRLCNYHTIGIRYEKGINIEGLVQGQNTYSQTSSGIFWDEDIKHTVIAQSTHKFLYRIGANGNWEWSDSNNKISLNIGGTYDVWNKFDGSTWSLAESLSDKDFWNIHFFIFPNLQDASVVKIVGQNVYSTINEARNSIKNEIASMKLMGLPSQKFKHIYSIIVNNNGELQYVDSKNNLIYDVRNILGNSEINSIISNHASEIEVDVTNFNNNLSDEDTDIQKALETLNTKLFQYIPSIHAISYSESLNFDFENRYSGNHEVSITGDLIPSISNVKNGGVYIIMINIDSTGGYSINPNSSFGTKTANSIDNPVNNAIENATYIYTIVVSASGNRIYTLEIKN